MQEQELLFFDVVATKASVWTPSSGILPPHLQDDGDDNVVGNNSEFNELDGEPSVRVDDTQQTNIEGISMKRNAKGASHFPTCSSQKKQKKMSTAKKITKCLERLVDTVIDECISSHASISSARCFTIHECVNILDGMPGIVEGDRLWIYAIQLFLKLAMRVVSYN